jgi:hypothetical protein
VHFKDSSRQLHYTHKVQTAQQRGTYRDFQIKRSWQEEMKLDMIIDITADISSATNISPVTISMTLSSTASMMSTLQSSKRTRHSSKQASEQRLKSKQTKVDYDNRYQAAFKKATNLIAERTAEAVGEMCQKLNKVFDLDGKKRLARSIMYRAYKDGNT